MTAIEEFREVRYIEKIGKYNFNNKYKCSDIGLIYNTNSNQPLKPFSDGRRGYLKVKLYDENNKPITLFVHRIICEVFNGLPPSEDKNHTNHIDGNKWNNFKENLEWISPRDNVRHSIENKLSISRSNQLSIQNVHKICEELFVNKKTAKQTSVELDLSYDAIHKILVRKNYSYISELYINV